VRDLLVTGTDTGVGKTVIAAALVTALRSRGVCALGFKPVETGCDAGDDPDSEILARASGERVPLAAPLLQLREPLAPAVAAERAGTALNPADVESRMAQLRRDGYTLVVEGAGGVLVPLCWEEREERGYYTVLDLAERCALDAIVVARAGLGTLNHTALTVLMLKSRNVVVRGIVLNGRGANADTSEATNPTMLARMLPGVPVVEVPLLDSGDLISQVAAILDQLL